MTDDNQPKPKIIITNTAPRTRARVPGSERPAGAGLRGGRVHLVANADPRSRSLHRPPRESRRPGRVSPRLQQSLPQASIAFAAVRTV